MLSAIEAPPPGEQGFAVRARARADRGSILVVEDTPANAEVVCEILRLRGHDVVLATDGLQAVEAIRERPFDLVLMDCQLPGIDGYEATRRVRALEAEGALPRGPRSRERLPIYALTASATVEDLARVTEAGMDRHIAKPIDARGLVAVVASAIWPSRANETDTEARAVVEASLAVVDLDKTLARIQGNEDLLGRLILQFRVEAHKAGGALQTAWDHSDKAALLATAHRLRGQALGLDAEALVAELSRLEETTDREAWDEAAASLGRVHHEIDRVLDALTHG
jgi:CheY-like chemotaxis protein